MVVQPKKTRAGKVLRIFNKNYHTKKDKNTTKSTLKYILREMMDLKRKIRFISMRRVEDAKLIDLINEIETADESLIHYQYDTDMGTEVQACIEHLREAARLLSQKDGFTSALEIDRGINALTDAIAIFEMKEWKLEMDEPDIPKI